MIKLRRNSNRLFPLVIISCLVIWSILPAKTPTVIAKPAATTITVDYLNDNPTLSACTGVANDCSLRGAVDHVNNDLGTAYIIQIPDGTYTLNHNSGNATEDNNASGDLDILNPDVTLQGTSMTGTLINGNNTDRVIDLLYDLTVVINDLTLYNGNLLTGEGGGGGLRIGPSNTVTLNRVTIRNNIVHGTASSDLGGGIYNGLSPLTINDSHISSNQAYRGGGIYLYGDLFEMNNSEVDNNTATDLGGGLLSGPGGTATITGCLFDGNTADRGGGIQNSTATLILKNSTLQYNHSDTSGGGLELFGSSKITNVTLYHNTAVGLGGGINSNQQATLVNVTLVDNASTGSHGGGLYVMNPSTLSLDHVTFSGNTALNLGDGINVGVGAQVTAVSSLFTGPTAGNVCYIENAPDWTSNGYNLSSDTSCNLTGTGDQASLDPKLGTYGDHGGPTPTLSLLATSPAIDHGNMGDAISRLDQRGVAIMGGRSDVGAYEFIPPSLWLPLIRKS
jgi:hypothetical protein